MAKMGRPKKEIDRDQFEKLCALHCTQIEMASFFDCTDDTIENWCKSEYGETFSEVYKLKKGTGRISLRRKQFEVAMAGNVSMLIWLGKNWLDQTDKTELSTGQEKPIELIYKISKKVDEANERDAASELSDTQNI
jgi:hypothetical protein